MCYRFTKLQTADKFLGKIPNFCLPKKKNQRNQSEVAHELPMQPSIAVPLSHILIPLLVDFRWTLTTLMSDSRSSLAF